MIAILGEYDALFGLSQEKGEAVKKPVVPGGGGHGAVITCSAPAHSPRPSPCGII
ncbi:hypothetical protein LJK88_28375 [Paenibacillus sp. P26]|nr:hypothetical protein LJK88_28375 [Paenibacillus sp. P26]